MFYGAVIMTKLILRVHPVHLMNREQHQATLRPGQPTWAVSPPVGCYCLHPPSPCLIYYCSARKLISFYLRTKDRRLSRPRLLGHAITNLTSIYKDLIQLKHTGFLLIGCGSLSSSEPSSSSKSSS